MKLGIGRVNALADSELVQVGSVRRVEHTAPIVFGVGIMICHAFSTEIVEGAVYDSWNLLRAAQIVAVVKWSSLVLAKEI